MTSQAIKKENPVQVPLPLDAAVADAYGWTRGMSEQEVLRRLLELNLR